MYADVEETTQVVYNIAGYVRSVCIFHELHRNLHRYLMRCFIASLSFLAALWQGRNMQESCDQM